MGISRSPRPASIALAAVLTACGGESLTLPGDGAPAGGAPAALTAVSGYDQAGTVGSRLDEPLVVRVTDSGSNPLAGIAIEFRFQSEIPGAEVDPTVAATNAHGIASARVRLGEDSGSQPVEAQVAQESASNLRATFDLTALADEKGKKKDGGPGSSDDDDDEDDD